MDLSTLRGTVSGIDEELRRLSRFGDQPLGARTSFAKHRRTDATKKKGFRLIAVRGSAVRSQKPFAVKVNKVSRVFSAPHFCLPRDLMEVLPQIFAVREA